MPDADVTQQLLLCNFVEFPRKVLLRVRSNTLNFHPTFHISQGTLSYQLYEVQVVTSGVQLVPVKCTTVVQGTKN